MSTFQQKFVFLFFKRSTLEKKPSCSNSLQSCTQYFETINYCCYYLVRCHPGADGGQDEDVGLPHDGHGNAKHPLDVERADEEEDGEGPVLDAHHDDVQGCEVVPPEVQTLQKRSKIFKYSK